MYGTVPVKLNVGCGHNKLDNYINIDINEIGNEPDVAVDIRIGLPFPDNSIQEILFFHTIEHIEEKYHFKILAEFHRVLKFDGIIYIRIQNLQNALKIM